MMTPSTILITGANRGIGLALVKEFLSSGNSVIATCRNPDLASALQEMAKENSRLSILPLDVTDKASIDTLVRTLEGKVVDVLVNNAGILSGVDPSVQAVDEDQSQTFGTIDAGGLETLFKVNVIAPVMVTQALAPSLMLSSIRKVIMISSGWGCISSMDIETPPLGYGVSKAALNAAAKMLSIALRPEGFTVISLTPGWVETDMGGCGADWTPAQSAQRMAAIISSLSKEQSGQFIKHSGEVLPW